ncbi:hypothetical protein C8R44DRAFT_856808 [Mycena epipterygia]|nr:hypothetical protein C8R44DRAFT_856808 [Mycena epipterygia]
MSRPKSERHEHFYFPDGSAIFSMNIIRKDGNPGIVLYKLHSSMLASRSAFFATMFSLPRGEAVSSDIRSEGTADDNPIELCPNIGEVDFDNLLFYLYRGPPEHPKTNEFLESVLALSTFFGIEDGISHAVGELTRAGNDFHPALQFHLARRYRVDKWIEPAFRKLVEIPIRSLTTEHVDQIGTQGFFHLVQTKEKMLTVRREIAFHIPPTVNHPDCDTPASCSHAWAREWCENVPRIIHHPDAPSGCVDLLLQLRVAEIDNLCKACQDLSVTWLWGKGWVQREEEKVDEAIAILMALQTGVPVRAHLHDEAHVDVGVGQV